MAEPGAFRLTPKVIGERLNVSVGAVLALIHAGKLPAIKVGRSWRISEADFEVFVRQQRAETRQRGLRARLLRGGADSVPAFLRSPTR